MNSFVLHIISAHPFSFIVAQTSVKVLLHSLSALLRKWSFFHSNGSSAQHSAVWGGMLELMSDDAVTTVARN